MKNKKRKMEYDEYLDEVDNLTTMIVIEREELNDTFRGGEFVIEEKHLEFLMEFSSYKKFLEEYYGKEKLIYFDNGNDFRTTWAIRIEDDNCIATLSYGYNDDKIKDKIMELYPYTDYEIKLQQLYEEKLKKESKERIFKVTERTQDKFRFRKYKGKKVLDVYEKDKGYIDWCIENVDGFNEYLKKIKRKNNLNNLQI